MAGTAPEAVPQFAVLRNRLQRFLHTGSEMPKYHPGCWTTRKYFEEDKLVVINEILTNLSAKESIEMIDLIVKAYKDNWFTRFDTIAFALTKFIFVGDKTIKETAYKAAMKVCNNAEEMMLFNKYTRILKTGNGKGWCKAVKSWYMEKEPMELAKEVTRVKSRHGRTHQTLIRKCHLNVGENNHARDAVIKYVLYGLKRAKQLVSNVAETKDIIEYIQKVEDLRHCEDPFAASKIASLNQFTLDHVPGHLIIAQPVWDAILPQFSVEDLLKNILRIHNMGFLSNDSTTTAVVLSLLSNTEKVKKSKITPLAVYITLCNYKNKYKPTKHPKLKVLDDKAQRRRERQIFNPESPAGHKRHPKELKHVGIDYQPCFAVLGALTKLMEQSWLLTPATGLRYMITMDMRHNMFKGRHFCKVSPFLANTKKGNKALKRAKPSTESSDADKKGKKHLLAECFHQTKVTPGHAALTTALHLLKREKHVTLAIFTEDGIQNVTIEKNFSTLEEAEFVFRQNPNLGRVQLDAPIKHAMNVKKKVDVFINIIDRQSRYMELEYTARGGRGPAGRFGPPPAANDERADRCPVRALLTYRAQMKQPNTKLITMSLASHRVGSTDGSHEGVLDIVGIDEYVPKVIDAFSLGQFK